MCPVGAATSEMASALFPRLVEARKVKLYLVALDSMFYIGSDWPRGLPSLLCSSLWGYFPSTKLAVG
jgi:hypothetical protein